MTSDGTVRLPGAPTEAGSDTDGLYDVLAAGDRPAPGRGPQVLADLVAAAQTLDEAPAVLTQLGEQELTDLVGVLLRVQARAVHVAALATADAAARGTVHRSDAASTQQWVTGCATGAGVSLEPRDASTVAVVAEACQDRRNRVITAAVRDGCCTLTTARRVVQHTRTVAKLLPTASREEIHGWFLQLDPAYGARGVAELTRKLQARYDPDTLAAEDAHLDDVESLSWQKLATGMWRLIADLSPAHAALLKQALTAMSAPHPATGDGNASGNNSGTDDGRVAGPDTGERVRDDRLPGKRRLDALMDLVAAGAKVGCGDGTGVGAAATVLVTLDLDALITGIGGATTITGEVLDAGAARRLACDADLIPIVLGTASQPLDVGRAKRLVTKGIRAAVVHRDRGCSFPGCDRPPGWCDVHHLRPWWAGGETSLANSAMLCRRHHQIVHRHGYTATPTDHGLVWDLTKAAMPGWTHEGYKAAS